MFRSQAPGMLMALLVLGLLWPAAVAHAQQPSAPPASKQQEGDQSISTLQVNVNVVNLFFNVKDKHGTLIPDLKRDDFKVIEDGRLQTIKYFASESDQPLTLGILIDSSVSQDRVLPMEKEVGAAFLKEVLRPKDEAFVISFDVNVDLLQDFTNSTSMLRTALNEAKINGGGGCSGIPGLGGGPVPCTNPKGTLLYDAVFLAGREKLASEVGRKAMIILTDGEDQGSQETIRSAIEAAQKSDSICYVLLIADRGFYGLGGYSGDRAMKELAQETGGRVINVGNKPEKLKEAFDQIANELRTQYSIGYTPTNGKRDGGFRRVEVKTKEGYKVQCRSGYYALPPRGEGE
ncbi:MAG: VWA domain-containing protein [Acidobacteriota bacterium]